MTFHAAYEHTRGLSGLSLISEDRLALLWAEAQGAPPGAFAEVGVYQGGSALLLRLASPGRTIHLFDTFTGHPATGHEDTGQWLGRFADTDWSPVAQAVATHLHIGAFPASIPADWAPQLALVHVDVDTYQSTKDAIGRLVPLLVKGGVLICDDYGFCPGAKRAVDEYTGFTVLPTGQALLRKAA